MSRDFNDWDLFLTELEDIVSSDTSDPEKTLWGLFATCDKESGSIKFYEDPKVKTLVALKSKCVILDCNQRKGKRFGYIVENKKTGNAEKFTDRKEAYSFLKSVGGLKENWIHHPSIFKI